MKIAQITFTSRMGLPSYSHEEIVATAVLDESKSSIEQMAELKMAVNAILYGKAPTVAAVQTSVVNKETVATKSVDLAATPGKEDPYKNVTPMKDGVTAEEAKKQEAAKKAEAVTKELEEKAAKAKAAADAKAAKEAEKAAKAASKTVEKYDPNIKEHTDTVAATLNKLFGDSWKADKAKAKKVSRETLVGFDFRNKETGEILESFTAELNKHFGDGDSAL